MRAMTANEVIADAGERWQALDPARSFIVQAPAGSGKTELLIQRYLALLTLVESPEEIAAITFTRKAATEMRNRVLGALHAARNEREPESSQEGMTREFARAAVRRDIEKGWQIEANPSRLRIQTIDSLCNSLTRQMPVLSRFGSPPAIVEDAHELYREAARATLGLLDGDAGFAEDVARLLSHLDNNAAVAEELFTAMLCRRDQWVRHLPAFDRPLQRERLEASLARVREDALARTRDFAPDVLMPELLAIADFAAHNITAEGKDSPILNCLGLADLPGGEEADLPAWLGLAELLLTKEGNWRKSFNTNQGLPAPGSEKNKAKKQGLQEAKDGIAALANQLAGRDAFREALHELRALPTSRYSEAQWEALGAIARLLPVAVAQLKLVFRERGQADFTEIAQAAVHALGTESEPTDLGLALDYRIHHLLIDEFQDTSLSQFALLEGLTAGWEPGDGRTVFAVGDPMQSIYRFREAEVGLFLKARHEGIGQVRLAPLTLKVNFRSQQGIVDWVNRTFQQVMPATEDIGTGAVPYSLSVAHHPLAQGQSVTVHPLFEPDRGAEADHVVELVRNARAEHADANIAILVRSRGHLAEIVPRLKHAGFRFRAIEIELLGYRPVVQDLLALTRALSHPADRLAWLAVLRAPWCGLTLADLEALAGDDFDATMWQLMNDRGRIACLSDDGSARLGRLRGVLEKSIASRGRDSLRSRVEGAWLGLGGPACVEDPTDLEDAEVYLDFLEETERSGEISDFDALHQGLAKLYALPDVYADDKLQIMTIHKAKGLEFDTVIVPGLGYRPPRQETRLLMWIERPLRQARGGLRAHGSADLLLAPVKQSGADSDPIYSCIARLNREKESNEDSRLLYVAATRAKRRLHLLGHVKAGYGEAGWEVKTPDSGSLLARLWPAVHADFLRKAAALVPPASPAPDEIEGARSVVNSQAIRRLEADWDLPDAPPSVAWGEQGVPAHEATEIEFSWVGETARLIGTVVHRWLQAVGEDAMQGWDRGRVEALAPSFKVELSRLGVPQDEVDGAAKRVVTGLAQTLEDERGRWLLGRERQDARCEFRLTGFADGRLVNVVIDRTFVDEHGVRWIVDYKTSTHEGSDPEGFLDRERERYAAQMARYAILMGRLERRPVRLGLYFPLLGGWREWKSEP